MRFLKALAVIIPLKLVWIRITSSRWTLAFFLTAVAHCLLQLGLEAAAFTNNYKAINRLQSIISVGDGKVNDANFDVAIWQNGNLSVCQGLPSASTCQVVWRAEAQASNSTEYPGEPVAPGRPLETSRVATATSLPPAATATPTASEQEAEEAEVEEDDDDDSDTESVDSDSDDDEADETELAVPVQNAAALAKRSIVQAFNEDGKFIGVLIADNDNSNSPVLASPICVASLHVPLQALLNAQRVDVTFLSYQIWVFGMSFVAVLNESVPHIIASFLTHIVATLWSGYQVYHSQDFHTSFSRLVVNGPCNSNILTDFWGPRDHFEIGILVLNCIAVVVVGFLSYKLLKAYGWQTFKKIGASFTINRCYRLVLAFSITIQLAVFFVGANIGLWLDQLYNGTVGPFAEHKKIYEGVYITALIMLIPWLAIGWYAVRKESRVWMAVFLGMASVMITGWASMFASRTFLWTFRAWRFFAFMTVAAAVLLAAAISLGVACRLNFGKGLPEYLVREELGAEPAWEPAMEKSYGDEEKLVQFPSETSPQPIPTFSEAFVGPDGLDRLRAMSRPAARSGPGIGMHARGTSTSGSMDFASIGLPTRPDALVTINRSASTASRSTLSSVDTIRGQPMMNTTDPRLPGLARINTSDSHRSHSSQNSSNSSASRLNRSQRWEIDV